MLALVNKAAVNIPDRISCEHKLSFLWDEVLEGQLLGDRFSFYFFKTVPVFQ